MKAVHPVFHVSQLELSTPNTIPNRIQPPPPPVEVDDDIEYEIAEILNSKLDQCRKCKLLYLVRWAGYEGTDQELDWLVATELTHASELVADFHSAHPSRPGPLNSLRFKTSYLTIIRFKKKTIWRGRKFNYSRVPSGSGVFAPIPEPPVLGDHSGIGLLANSPTSASDSPGNSQTLTSTNLK